MSTYLSSVRIKAECILFLDYEFLTWVGGSWLNVGRQHVITKDTVQTDIDALVYFRVTDPRLAVFRIENVPVAIELATQGKKIASAHLRAYRN